MRKKESFNFPETFNPQFESVKPRIISNELLQLKVTKQGGHEGAYEELNQQFRLYEQARLAARRQFAGEFGNLHQDLLPHADNPAAWDQEKQYYDRLYRQFLEHTLESLKRIFGYSEAQMSKVRASLEPPMSEYQALLTSVIEHAVTDKELPVTDEQHEVAFKFNLSYATGELWRKFAGGILRDALKKDELRNIVEKYHRDKFEARDGQTKGQAFVQELLNEKHIEPSDLHPALNDIENNDWLLGGLGRRPIDIASNFPGQFATDAMLNFAQALMPSQTKEELVEVFDDLFNRSEEELYTLCVDPRSTKERIWSQVIIFGLSAANLGWILYKPAQAVIEHRAGKTGNKGMGRVRYNADPKQGNEYFMPFDSMASEKKWPAALIDKDQLEMGIELLRAKMLTKKQGVSVANAAD